MMLEELQAWRIGITMARDLIGIDYTDIEIIIKIIRASTAQPM